jgi:two-component system, OmpR family, response regulator
VKLLVVEDNRKFSSFLVRALGEEGYVVDAVFDGSKALEQAEAIAYDGIILDWMLPSLDGVSICRALRDSGNRVPILMLTARNETGERVLGLDAGADDYLVKPFELDEFLARVRAMLRRGAGTHSDANILKLGTLSLDRNERRATFAGRKLDLTAREFAVLAHFVREKGRIVTRSELLSKVWQTSFDPSSNVVDVHIRNLREKLRADVIETIRGAGYRIVPAALEAES